MGLGAALAGAVGGPLLALGGFGLVAAVAACLVVPLLAVWLRTARPGGPSARGSAGRASVEVVRLQEFWSRMSEQFGSMRAESVARDHVFSALGGRSAVEAIDAGVPVRKVWLAICEEYDVPPKDR